MTDLPTVDPAQLDAPALFSRLPPNRVGEVDRQYVDEVLKDGFGNRESADMLGRFERAFADKFDVPFAISHNSGSGTMLSCLLAAGVGPGDEVIVPTCYYGINCLRRDSSGRGAGVRRLRCRHLQHRSGRRRAKNIRLYYRNHSGQPVRVVRRF